MARRLPDARLAHSGTRQFRADTSQSPVSDLHPLRELTFVLQGQKVAPGKLDTEFRRQISLTDQLAKIRDVDHRRHQCGLPVRAGALAGLESNLPRMNFRDASTPPLA